MKPKEDPKKHLRNDLKFTELIHDKSLCIVGNGKTADWKRAKECDYVARINSSWSFDEGPCHILYHACENSIEKLTEDERAQEIQFAHINIMQSGFKPLTMFCRLHEIPHTYFVAGTAENTLPCVPSFEWINPFIKSRNFVPLTGLIALYDILRRSPKSVFLTGQNLYQDQDPPPERMGPHWMDKQAKYLKEVMVFDKRVEFDYPLKEAVASVLAREEASDS